MKMPDHFVASHQSIDGYLLLRFLKVSIVISLVGCCITWPLLFSINVNPTLLYACGGLRLTVT